MTETKDYNLAERIAIDLSTVPQKFLTMAQRMRVRIEARARSISGGDL